MRYIRLFMLIPVFGLCMLMFSSCNRCSREQKIEEITVDIADLAVDSSYMRIAHQVFYSLPTPIEISLLIRNLGVGYQGDLLNDPANASKYLTNHKMAINFGVYITDLTDAGLFIQTQTVLRYKTAIQQMAEGLGILSAIDPGTMKKMEDNLNNREEMLEIISDTYSSCTAYLNEDDRYFLTLAVFTGGWVEGMYIASSLVDEKQDTAKDKMEQLVINQKLTFAIIWQAMSELKENPEVAALMDEMSGLHRLFESLNLEQGKNQVSFSNEDKATVLKSSVSGNITPEIFVQIKDQIKTLRQNFTQK